MNRRRLARYVGAVAAIGGLAGCSSLPLGRGGGAGGDGSPGGGGGTGSMASGTGGEGSPGTGGGCDPMGSDGTASGSEDLQTELFEKRQSLARLQAIRNWYPGGFDGETLDAAEAVGKAARGSVVHLQAKEGGFATSTSTAWYVGEDRLLTNSHNVMGATSLTATTLSGVSFGATVLGRVESMSPDVALLRAERTGPPLPTGTAEDLALSEPLVQVGHPGGFGNWVVSVGLVVRTAAGPTFTTSLPGLQGNSGSPVLTLDGTVVGMTNGGLPLDQRAPAEPPEPSDPIVYDWPIGPRSWGFHDTIDAATDAMAAWV